MFATMRYTNWRPLPLSFKRPRYRKSNVLTLHYQATFVCLHLCVQRSIDVCVVHKTSARRSKVCVRTVCVFLRLTARFGASVNLVTRLPVNPTSVKVRISMSLFVLLSLYVSVTPCQFCYVILGSQKLT